MKVFVYFNLHKKVWSIKALEGDHKGRVIAHASEVMLAACEFKVSQKGRERVLREKRKNVHAGVVGMLDAFVGTSKYPEYDRYYWRALDRKVADYALKNGFEVTYNPYKWDSFVYKNSPEWKIERAIGVYMGKRSVNIFAPEWRTNV